MKIFDMFDFRNEAPRKKQTDIDSLIENLYNLSCDDVRHYYFFVSLSLSMFFSCSVSLSLTHFPPILCVLFELYLCF